MSSLKRMATPRFLFNFILLFLFLVSTTKALSLTYQLDVKSQKRILVIKGKIISAKDPFCWKAENFSRKIKEDVRYYKLKKYLRFAPALDSQITYMGKKTAGSFELVIKDRIGFERDLNHHQWVLDGILPMPINCKTKELLPVSLSVKSDNHYTQPQFSKNGQIFIAFTRDMKTISKSVNEQKIELHYFSDSTADLFPVIEKTYNLLSAFTSNHQTAEIVETDYQFSNSSKKVLLYNTSNSETSKRLQKFALNISEWNLVYLLVDQWLSSEFNFIKRTPSLRMGITEYLTGYILKSIDGGENFFKPNENGSRIFDVSYDSVSNLLLTNYVRNKSVRSIESQSSSLDRELLWGLRFAAALKSLSLNHTNFVVIESLFKSLSKTQLEYRRNNSKEVLISNLHAELDDQNSRYSLEVLNYWLKSDVIPDFRLKEVSYSTLKKNGYFKTELELEHNYIPGQVIKVRLEDSNGMAIETIRLKKSKDKYVVYTSRKVKSTMVNPGEKIYEMSKFNNRDGFNPVSFFPGSAKRLYDDKYLIAWLPTMSKEPSKPFTLGVNGAILKYLWSRTLFDFSITDNLDLNSYSLNYMSSDIFQYTDLSFGLGKDEYGISSMNLILSGRGTWGLFEPLTTSLIAQAYIEEDTILNSHTLDLNLEKMAGSLSLNLGYSNEQAIGFFKKTKKIVSVQLSLPSRFSFGVRLFSGDLNIDSNENEEISKETLTERYGFYPYNLEESRIRVNDESITSSAAISAFSSDIKVPLGLFTGGMGLIGNRLLGRIFHDQAVTANHLNYEASGIGIELPFGGDVVGGGTVVIANLTVLVGLRQKIADITSEEPYMVFSFTGRL